MSEKSDMWGKGKYDEVAQFVQHIADAALVAVIVVNGKRGTGLSVCSVDREASLKLPEILRRVAELIEEENKGIKAN